MAGLPEEERWI